MADKPDLLGWLILISLFTCILWLACLTSYNNYFAEPTLAPVIESPPISNEELAAAMDTTQKFLKFGDPRPQAALLQILKDDEVTKEELDKFNKYATMCDRERVIMLYKILASGRKIPPPPAPVPQEKQYPPDHPPNFPNGAPEKAPDRQTKTYRRDVANVSHQS